ncbi:cation-translocating P-type ATPase [Croceicoccus ponticola]|nr:HAD-IC family P-type ATPase [Croceicoccus ponticola]
MKRDIPADRAYLLRMMPDEGLPEIGASAMRVRFGNNLIAEQRQRSGAAIARDTARDPMLWFLLMTSAILALFGQIFDAGVLLVAIVPLLGMDFYLHRRTQASIEGLSSALASEAMVIRDGAARRIPAKDVVAGDLAVIAAGETFPADGVVVAADGLLQAEEFSLTGEAFPVIKRACSKESEPGEATWVFAGTRLLTGAARIRVLMVGRDTIYGEVVRSVVDGPQAWTPLQTAVAGLVKRLLVVALVICVILAAVRVWQGFGWTDAFLSAAVLAVAAIPEEFPVVLTFFLGVGVYRLAKRRALVRNAVAVENIGRTSAICTDKTGTITEGQLKFSDAIPATADGLDWLLKIASLAAQQDGIDPLDVAILDHAPPVDPAWIRLRLFPFTESRRRESAFWMRPSEVGVLAVKGAPETVLALCDMDAATHDDWLEKVRDLSGEAKKVIACAWTDFAREPMAEPDGGCKFAGLIAVSDPIRPGVREAMAQARAAGVQVVMVTGDHLDTAAAIARQAGLTEAPDPVSGDRLEQTLKSMGQDDLRRLGIVARASPAQKVMLVKALQDAGRIVAVTGDGVNDAPALRAADIGIAMGLRGTRSAREVSQIVLMDDNFSTIIAAMAEGRQLFRNLRLSFAFLLMVHIPLVATAALIPLLGYPLLYLPVHIVLLELLIHPAAILSFQKPADDGLAVRDGRTNRFFAPLEWLAIAVTGTAIGGAILTVFVLGAEGGTWPEHGRAMAIVALFTALATMLLILTRGATVAGRMVAMCAIAAGFAFSQVEVLGRATHMHQLSIGDWLAATACGILPALGAAILLFTTDSAKA